MRFLTLHYAYFIGTCLISSLILWGAAHPLGSLRYIDALFLAVSAMTLAGLNTVNLSTLNTFQQLLLFFLIILGSAVSSRHFTRHQQASTRVSANFCCRFGCPSPSSWYAGARSNSGSAISSESNACREGARRGPCQQASAFPCRGPFADEGLHWTIQICDLCQPVPPRHLTAMICPSNLPATHPESQVVEMSIGL